MHRHRRHRSVQSQRVVAPTRLEATADALVLNPPSIFQRILVWLFHLLVITTPLFFTFTTDELFEFNKMILTYVFVVLICVVWIGRMIFEHRLIWRHTKIDYLLGLFLISQLASTLFSIHPYTSWFGYYSRFHGGFVSLFSYALLYWAFISNITRKDLRPLALSTMVAGSLVSLYAIGEHFGHSVSCWMTSGGTAFGADCWVQDVQHRVFATFGQPNWLAAYVLMLLSALIGMLLGTWPSRWERIGYYSCYALLFWTLLYTRSRSGILGFTVAVLVILAGLLLRWWLQRREIQSSRWRQPAVITTGIIALITLGAVVLSGTPYSPSISDLFSRQTQSGVPTTEPAEAVVANRLDIGGTDSGEIRKIVWQGALDVWKRYPVFGSGVETFAYSYYQDRPVAHNLVSEWDFLYNKAHNEFLNFLATTGIFGLGTYLALLLGYGIIATVGYVRLVRANKLSRAYLVLSLVAAVTGLSVSNFFGFSTVVVTILQYLAFAITMVLILPQVIQPKVVRVISLWQLALMVFVAVVAFFPLKGILDFYRADLNYTAGKALMAQGEIQAAALKLSTAIKLSPREALFWDELGQLYAQAAVTYFQTQTAQTTIDQLVSEAITSTDRAIELNDRQLNLYKTRARIFIMLSEIDPKYLQEAIKTLETAITLSPTDPKLLYNLGLLKFQQGDTVSGFSLLEKAISLKPNYGSALVELSQQEWAAGRQQEAIAHLEQMLEYEPNAVAVRDQLASYSAQLQKNSKQKQ